MEQKFSVEKVLWVKRHSPKHLTFAITRPKHFRFDAGQFARLGFTDGVGYIWRAYSMISAEYDETLIFFVVLIEGGAMSARLEKLKPDDDILLDKTAQGFFLPERFVDGEELIMLATGSGIAPFLSILQQPEVWQRFPKIMLAHSVSYHNELIFNDFIQDLAEHPLVGEYHHALHFVALTTRENDDRYSHFRLPEGLENGCLAQKFGIKFQKESSRFMICGNPMMVQDTFKTLLNQGFAMHRNKMAGHILLENGF